MRLNLFSPLPPVPSDIGNHTLIVARALAEFATVTLWTPASAPAPAATNFDVIRFEPDAMDWRHLNAADASVFNIGNNWPFHRDIFAVSRRAPGITVLHDTALGEFFLPLSEGSEAERLLWRQLMAQAHGAPGEAAGERWLAGALNQASLLRDFPMTLAALDGAAAAIVHNGVEAARLAAQSPIPVHHVPLAFAAGPRAAPNGRAGEPIRLVVFGYLGRNRRLPQILDALAGIADPAWRLDIYGRVAEPEPLLAQIASAGLQDRVAIHGFVPESALAAALAGADLALNLRYPSVGEVSGSQLRLWSAGVPSLVTRTGWYATLPPGSVFFVEPDGEAAGLQRHLAAYARDPAPFRAAADAGRALVETEHAPRGYALRLLALAAALPRYQASRTAAHLQARAASLGYPAPAAATLAALLPSFTPGPAGSPRSPGP